jgi:hypothetical protein
VLDARHFGHFGSVSTPASHPDPWSARHTRSGGYPPVRIGAREYFDTQGW